MTDIDEYEDDLLHYVVIDSASLKVLSHDVIEDDFENEDADADEEIDLANEEYRGEGRKRGDE